MVRAKKTLLLVKLGNEGRLPFLQEFDKVVENIVGLVSTQEAKQAGWASELLHSMIVYDEDLSSFDTDCGRALAAVKQWTEETGTKIDGVASYDEFGIELCSFLVAQLGAAGVPLATMQGFRDKLVFRQRCAAAGIPTVRFAGLSSAEDVETVVQDNSWKYPVVLKPRKGAGSWYVKKVAKPEDLMPTWKFLRERMMSEEKFPAEIRNSGFLLEEFFDGKREIDIDGWARKGELEFSLVSDNNPAIEPNFLETGGTYPSQLPEEATNALTDMLKDILKAFPGVQGCFHFEAKLGLKSNPDGSVSYTWMPIEMNCRVGGAECPASFRACTGYQLAQVCAMLALDLPIPAPEQSGRHAVVSSTNLHPSQSGTVLEVHKDNVDMEGNKVVTFALFDSAVGKKIDIKDRNGSSTCFGWIASGGATPEQSKQNLDRAIAQTVITIRGD